MAITTQFKTYPSPHGKNEGSGGGVTYIMGNVGNSNLPSDLNVSTISAESGDIDNLQGKQLSYNTGQFLYIASSDGSISKLRGEELNYKTGKFGDLFADAIETGKIKATEAEIDKAWIETLNSTNITTDYLTVTKQAHFFELIIDKIRSVGGTIIETAANCVIDYVKAYSVVGGVTTELDMKDENFDDEDVTYYDIYWKANDSEGRATDNMWLVNDQAICQSFNVKEGANYNVSNKYYWRLVTYKHADTYMNLTTGEQTNDPNVAQVNAVQINEPIVTYKVSDTGNYDIDNPPPNPDPTQFDLIDATPIQKGFVGHAQTIEGIVTGAEWEETQETPWVGTMTTTNTVFGVQLEIDHAAIANDDINISNVIPSNISFTCSGARLNVGFYFADGTSQYYPAPEKAKINYSFDFAKFNNDTQQWEYSTHSSIETILITNADELNWHQVHGIRLGNDIDNNERDANLPNSACVPSVGDNVAQLGYRWQGQQVSERASAIIIAAYNTPDSEVHPPSYAQYTGINDFSLSPHRKTYFDASKAVFVGDFKIVSNGDLGATAVPIDEMIPNLWIAYANSADGTVDFTTNPATGVSYLYMGICSSTADTAPQTPSSYKWTPITGASGANGDSIMFIYNNATAITVAPTSPAPYTSIPTGWSTTAETPPDHQYTWMSQATKRGIDGKYGLMGATAFNYGQWTTPVRITGDDGENGTDGQPGATGANGKYMEFIYTRNAGISGAPNPPAAPPVEYGPYPADWPNNGTTDHQADHNGTVWYDNPQGVNGTTALFEYMSQREYNGATFLPYTTPVVWSNWGVKGQDGDGYEYIYARNDSYTQGPNISYSDYGGKTKDDDGFVPQGWTDDPQGVSSSQGEHCEWVSTRKKTDGRWLNFSPPALWAQYVPPGTNGLNGSYTQFAYQNGVTATTPSSTSTYPPTGWSVSASTPPEGEYTWCINRTVSFDQYNNPNYGNWSNPPYRITGDNGKPGEDGNMTEFIYKRFADEQVWGATAGNADPHNWPIGVTADWTGPTAYAWNDNPLGVDGTYQYEYVASREYKYQTEGATAKSWGLFCEPALWSKWGVKGQDGDGYEYIYKLSNSESSWGGTAPKYITTPATGSTGRTKADDDFIPQGWDDEPLTLSQNNQFEWVSQRKKYDHGGATGVAWDDFSDPKIWAHWSDPGSEGPPGPQGPTGPMGPAGTLYMLIDQGSIATVNSSLVNGDVVDTLHISLRYKVVKIEGSSATYMSMGAMRDFPKTAGRYNGFYAYCRMSKDTSSTPNYRYFRMNLNTSAQDSDDAVFTYTPSDTSNPNTVAANQVITVALVLYNDPDTSQGNSIATNDPNLQYTYDTQTIQVSLQPTAAFEIVQGQNAKIASLVTGFQGQQTAISNLQGEVSNLWTGQQGQSTAIANMQSSITQQAGQINTIVNTTIPGIQTSISNVEQKADGIQSTVETMNDRVDNYFNFTKCAFQSNTYPYIQGYGFEGLISGAAGASANQILQVNNLDFTDNTITGVTGAAVGGVMSVRCDMKLSAGSSVPVLVGLCDTDPSNIVGATVAVTSGSWQHYTFEYDVTNANANKNNANGHIAFKCPKISGTDYRLYVANLMVSRGSVPIYFNTSWKDYDNSHLTRYSAIKIADYQWSYKVNGNSDKFVLTKELHKGYQVYKYDPQYPDTIVTKATTDDPNTYDDMISFNTTALEVGKHYTLSYYIKLASSTYQDRVWQAHCTDLFDGPSGETSTDIDNLSVVSNVDRTGLNVLTSHGNRRDGCTKFKLGTQWQKVTIHWYKYYNSANNIIIPLRAVSPDTDHTISWAIPTVYVAGVELREGWWDDNSLESSSLIAQSANEIVLKVKDTGINIDDGTITLKADNTIVDGNLVLKHNEGAQGLIFRNSSNQDGLKISTSNLPQLSTWLNGYQGYPKLDVATNGFGFQSGSRYLYTSTSDLALHDGNAGGVNNEYQIDVRLRQDGGNTGQIKDYIGSTEFGSSDVNTAYVKFLASETMVQHNGVRIIQPAHNYTYSNFQVSSKDKILLCDPNGDQQTSSELNQRAVTLNFPSNCVGHYYFIKRLHNVGRIYINGYVYAGTLNLADTPMHNPYIDDNGLWMAIVIDGLNSSYNTSTQIILNRIALNDRPNT